ncbi:hypothetical protein J1N35_034569 [Gossypium stocksii]|uniref:Uncharacterized protein n=1 Tax=Gossypium stocksii TaxID=47602 RepID=A0A9D3UT46_9ROSI|nr:hypothetical protein J1N35_034569 [Gossypium stocksii]
MSSLNQAIAYELPTHSSIGMRSKPWAPPTTWELTVSCSISLLNGGLSTLPSQYYSAIGHSRVFSLSKWSLLIHMGFHKPMLLRLRLELSPHLINIRNVAVWVNSRLHPELSPHLIVVRIRTKIA